MKKYMSAALLLVSQVAFAGSGSMTLGEYASLPDCGGTIKVTASENNSGEQVNVVFKDVVNCSNFDILAANGEMTSYANKKLGGRDRARSGSFTLPKYLIEDGANSVTVVVRSNSGQTSDTIRVKFLSLPVYNPPVYNPPVYSEPVIIVPGPSSGGGY